MLEQDPEPSRSIRLAIADHGPISFAEFMELALYAPNGFYERPPVGEGDGGHFVTSPHVHPVFGELLAEAINGAWSSLGRPDPLTLVEVGAGDGTLATQLRAALRRLPKRYVAIERSAGARESLRRLDPPLRVVASMEAVDHRLEGVVLANELLDNMPFHWIRRTGPWQAAEILVTERDGRFATTESPTEDWELVDAASELPIGSAGVFPEGALHFVERLARVLHRGYALLIDYSAGPDAEIHGYRGHRAVEDVLEAPGTADITAGVDFDALARRAQELGLEARQPVTQRSALRALGYDGWEERERRRQADAQDRRAGREAALAWSGRNAAHVLVDPQGLGRLRWLLLIAGGLAPPTWYLDAWHQDAEGRSARTDPDEPLETAIAPARGRSGDDPAAAGPMEGVMGFVDIPRSSWSYRRFRLTRRLGLFGGPPSPRWWRRRA
jgi:SAM-dependent MidA family methyltransferase